MAAEAARRNREQLARLGAQVRASRKRLRGTQQQLGAGVGLARSTIGAIERGHGGSHTLDTWQRLAVALDRPLIVEFARDTRSQPADAGHLLIQELVLRLGRAAGYRTTFELAMRPSDPSRSSDVGLRDDLRRRLILIECWNTIGDIGASAGSSTRKLAEAAQLAIAYGGDRPHVVAGCWVVRATVPNRALVARYPEVFGARFPGTSVGWLDALTVGASAPADPGLVWCDVAGTRLFAWRRPASSTVAASRPRPSGRSRRAHA